MNWRQRRQMLYISAASVVLIAIVGYLAYRYFTTPGSCFDNVQNDGEAGVDCGGPCAHMCASDTRDPVVEWARALKVATGTYDGVAYIDNPQYAQGAAAYSVGYSMRLLDANNQLIIERDGTVDLPPVETIPIFVPNIETGSETATNVQFSFTTDPIVWNKVPAGDLPALSVKNESLAPDGSRLSAEIVNESNEPVNNLTVAAVLLDLNGNALAASQSVIQQIPAEGNDTVVFTWPEPHQSVVRAEITPLPALPALQER
ncbi:MAG: hypothetical protein ACREGH_00495 [Minisyncoccia bacterium]